MGLFLSPLNTATGLGLGSISLAFAFGQLWWGLTQPFAGAMADKVGAGRVLLAGALLVALVTFITPYMTTTPGLILAIGILSAGGAGMAGPAVLMAATVRLIPQERRGLATGIVNADVVVMTTGHPRNLPRPHEQELADFAAQHGLHYVPGDSAADMPLEEVTKDDVVAVRGLGLTFYDVCARLTADRGGKFVRDESGIEGVFDVQASWRPDAVDAPVNPSDERPSFFSAIQEQLGLRLQPGRAPVEVLVIDSVERPTPN
jgi:hypothetical protein